jgi:hypothetical protein
MKVSNYVETVSNHVETLIWFIQRSLHIPLGLKHGPWKLVGWTCECENVYENPASLKECPVCKARR